MSSSSVLLTPSPSNIEIETPIASTGETVTGETLTREINFMGAPNFTLGALQRLYVVWTSGIIGEPQYYNDGDSVTKTASRSARAYDVSQYLSFPELHRRTSTEVFIKTLRDALDVDFKAVLNFAVQLRTVYMMRLGPQIILVEAALHPSRAMFNEENPEYFRRVAAATIQIPTDMKSQLEYYLKRTGGKAKLPGILKKCWKDAIEKLSSYQAAKYKNMAEIVDLIRLAHPRSSKNEVIADLVKDTPIQLEDDATTWEKLRSAGKSWTEILTTLGKKFPHMALLRNLKNISQEVSAETMSSVMDQLVSGVPFGKQFPFRYYTAYQQFATDTTDTTDTDTTVRPKVKHSTQTSTRKPPKVSDPKWKWSLWRKQEAKAKAKLYATVQEAIVAVESTPDVPVTIRFENPALIVQIVKDGLERAMKAAIANFPQLVGEVVSLSDNSGSAQGAFTSEYGTISVATIGNLSSLITALSATEGGYVGVFGDKLEMYKVSKDRGVMEQLDELNALGKTIGHGTENGIWLWFDKGFKDPTFNTDIDHLFVYSDMQAGHGGLYGINPSDYLQFTANDRYIDVIKLISYHRKHVNAKLNVFTVQTAGYDNSLIPEVLERSAILAGWTGNEVSYAKRMIDLWDAIDAAKRSLITGI